MGKLSSDKVKNPISTLAEFIERARLINDDYFRLSNATTHSWYRGQADSSWPLTPSLYRGDHWPDLEREMNRDFRLSAGPHFNHLPNDELEWLFAMQHYGIPTRLLDWTESHLYALLFAIADPSVTSEAAVWVLNPWELNMQSLDIYSAPLANDPILEGYRLGAPSDVKRYPSAIHPAALRPSRATPRIAAQRGAFTIHGNKQAGLWRTKYRKRFLAKISISGDAKRSLRRELHMAGIGLASLFPGLEGLGAEIKYRYSRDCIVPKA